jgi:hypothetical protein
MKPITESRIYDLIVVAGVLYLIILLFSGFSSYSKIIGEIAFNLFLLVVILGLLYRFNLLNVKKPMETEKEEVSSRIESRDGMLASVSVIANLFSLVLVFVVPIIKAIKYWDLISLNPKGEVEIGLIYIISTCKWGMMLLMFGSLLALLKKGVNP